MAPTSSFSRHDSHSTTSQASGWSTKRIAVTALFCAAAAIATLVLEFPLLPAAPWLKYDPSGIVALVAGFAFGPSTAMIVSVIPYLAHLTTSGGIYGVAMAILATFSLAVPASLVYQRYTSMGGAICGLVLGGLISLTACILGNLVITPLFMPGTSAQAVIAMIVPILLPFNLIKISINCIVSVLVYKPLSRALQA